MSETLAMTLDSGMFILDSNNICGVGLSIRRTAILPYRLLIINHLGRASFAVLSESRVEC